VSRYCGSPICAARIIAFEADPADPQVIPPCIDCLERMTDVLLAAQVAALDRPTGDGA
jgi:hypothetical protein